MRGSLSANGGIGSADAAFTSEIKFGELVGLATVLRDATLLSEGLIHSNDARLGRVEGLVQLSFLQVRGHAGVFEACTLC